MDFNSLMIFDKTKSSIIIELFADRGRPGPNNVER